LAGGVTINPRLHPGWQGGAILALTQGVQHIKRRNHAAFFDES
jgi:hypothetical protein